MFIIKNQEEEKKLISIGFKLLCELPDKQKIFICRSCNSIHAVKNINLRKKEYFSKQTHFDKEFSLKDSLKLSFDINYKEEKFVLDVELAALSDGEEFVTEVDWPQDLFNKLHLKKVKWNKNENKGENFDSSSKVYKFFGIFITRNCPECLFKKPENFSILQHDTNYIMWGVLNHDKNLAKYKEITNKDINKSDQDITFILVKYALIEMHKIYKINCDLLFTFDFSSSDNLEINEYYNFVLTSVLRENFYINMGYEKISSVDIIFDSSLKLINFDKDQEMAYQIFFKKIFKEYTLEEDYIISHSIKNNPFEKSIQFKKFNEQKKIYNYMKDYICYRIKNPSDFLYLSQCYFNDDFLNKQFDKNFDMRNYEKTSLDTKKLNEDYHKVDNNLMKELFAWENTGFSQIQAPISLENFNKRLGISFGFDYKKYDFFEILEDNSLRNNHLNRFINYLKRSFNYYVPIKFSIKEKDNNCKISNTFYLMRLIKGKLTEICFNNRLNIEIEELYYIKISLGVNNKIYDMGNEKFYNNMEDLKGFIPHPDFSWEVITESNQFNVDILVKPKIESGFVPLIDFIKGFNSKKCAKAYYSIWNSQVFNPLNQRKYNWFSSHNHALGKLHNLFYRFFSFQTISISKNSDDFDHSLKDIYQLKSKPLMNIMEARKLFGQAFASSGEKELTSSDIFSESGLDILDNKCDLNAIEEFVLNPNPRQMFLPLKISNKDKPFLDFKIDHIENIQYLIEGDSKQQGIQYSIDRIYYVEILFDIKEKEVYFEKYNYDMLIKYGFIQLFSENSFSFSFKKNFSDGVLRRFHKSRKNLGFRVWVRKDMRMKDISYKKTCDNQYTFDAKTVVYTQNNLKK